MATLTNVTIISYQDDTVTIFHDGEPTGEDFDTTSGVTLQFIKQSTTTDMDVTTGELSTYGGYLEFEKELVDIDFSKIWEYYNGDWYRNLIVIGEDDIRDGLYASDNRLKLGMAQKSISIKTDTNKFYIKKET